jgi:hypothetical protein
MVACIDFFEMSEICWSKFIVRHSTQIENKRTNYCNHRFTYLVGVQDAPEWVVA